MKTSDSRHDATDARPHSPERDASLDATFDALGNRDCRVLLRHLADSDEALVVDDLVDSLGDDATTFDADRLRARLHHNYLPKLVDAGLVEYDADRELVALCDDGRFEALTPTAEAFESAGHAVSLDALFDLLADLRRREAILALLDHEALSLPDLADEVAVAERDEPLTSIDADDVLRVYLSLYHTHVPKLAHEGLVDYDQDDDYVALTDAGRAVEPKIRSLCTPAED
jgi:DNA-binding transcriptional ArsR family regulator